MNETQHLKAMMNTMKLEKDGDVFVLNLSNGAAGNVLSDAVLEEYQSAFDAIEKEAGNSALIITCDDPKHFCNGIDLTWLMQQTDTAGYLTRLENMLIRLGLLNIPVIAAINGNAYAGGALLAAACDFRLMRADRGRFCYSEVNIKLPFTPVMIEIVNLLPARDAAIELALTGNAWGGEECAQRKIVNKALALSELMPAALTLARDLATRDRATYSHIKRDFRPALRSLAQQRQLL